MAHSTTAVQEIIDTYKGAVANADYRIDEVIAELNKLAELLEHGTMHKQVVLNQVAMLISAKIALLVREPVVL